MLSVQGRGASSSQSPLCSRFTCDSSFSSKHLIQAIKTYGRDQVIQTRYGINDITYSVSLTAPKMMIENEIYFPGWEAHLLIPDKQIKIQALMINDVFRAWLLPGGPLQDDSIIQISYIIRA